MIHPCPLPPITSGAWTKRAIANFDKPGASRLCAEAHSIRVSAGGTLYLTIKSGPEFRLIRIGDHPLTNLIHNPIMHDYRGDLVAALAAISEFTKTQELIRAAIRDAAESCKRRKRLNYRIRR